MKSRMRFALGLVATVLTVATPAWASFPGENGRIVFSSNRVTPSEIYSMNADGTDLRRLTWNTAQDQAPRVSHDGKRIVFARTVAGVDQDIWIMNADGSGERRLTSGPARDDQPVFFKDGEKVVFQRVAGFAGGAAVCPCEIRVVGADGEGERLVDTGPGDAANPDVSTYGKLAFVSTADGTRSVYVTDLRGGPIKRVTHAPAGLGFGDFRPRWSPRGNEIVFMRNDLGTLAGIDIWAVDKNGTDLRRLTTTERVEEFPQWSPDGERIVFNVLEPLAPFGGRIYTMDADGTDQRVIPQLVAPIVESFDDGRIDGSFWSTSASGTETSVAETNGRIEVAVGGAAAPGGAFLDAQQSFRCSAPGDFDVSVAYELLEWPAANFVQVALSAHFAGNFFVHRWNNAGGEHYVGHTPSLAASTRTTDMTGRLRLVRQDGIATALVQEGAGWRALASSPSSGSATLAIQAFSAVSLFGGRTARIAFDDFRLDAGELACPAFWRDAGPDWSVNR